MQKLDTKGEKKNLHFFIIKLGLSDWSKKILQEK